MSLVQGEAGGEAGEAKDAGVVIGIDAGGTGTRVVIVDRDGRERGRVAGPAGLIEPRDPEASAVRAIALVRAAAAEAGLRLPAVALCAGVAGAGALSLSEGMRSALVAAGLAERVVVVQDGEIALEGALPAQAGILLSAGTGSVAWGRGENGRVERCGGWGRFVGDEGSGWAIGRAGLQAALRDADGRGPHTPLLPELLPALGLSDALEIPPWVARAEKAEVAALAPRVLALARQGDAVAASIAERAADDLARHVHALLERLDFPNPPVPIVFHGGILVEGGLAPDVEARLGSAPRDLVRREPAGDALAGAVLYARAEAERPA